MYSSTTLYKLAKSIQEEHLREAEQIRLSRIAKRASAVKPKKRFWQFIFTNEHNRKSIAKPI